MQISRGLSFYMRQRSAQNNKNVKLNISILFLKLAENFIKPFLEEKKRNFEKIVLKVL